MRRKQTQIRAGMRRVWRQGGSLVVSLPVEFTRAHDIQEGDAVPVISNHILKIVPMPEAPDEEIYQKEP
ncbi:hypothetical protein M1O57_05065 [Dehalococcoidia bacterium]|nr:hypothetical protein [Dehalococcoidia bacterium]MCL0104939.1 hypothetical protein [Dehalococcoidia bacterium]